MNNLKIISLENCPYSMAAEDLIGRIKTSESENFNVEIHRVTQENKTEYQQGNIKTFPQIYLNKKLGGYDDLNEIYLEISRIKSLDSNEKLDLMIELLKQSFSFREKEMLRFIKFLIDDIFDLEFVSILL